MLDAMRSQDWVTRSARNRAKQLREAGQDQGKSAAELAAATGMTVAEVLETIALVSRKPVSIDAEPHDVPDTADVEGQAVVGSVLEAVSGALSALPAPARVILALRYYSGVSLPDAAELAGVKEEEASRLHNDAVLAVHDAMLRAVSLCRPGPPGGSRRRKAGQSCPRALRSRRGPLSRPGPRLARRPGWRPWSSSWGPSRPGWTGWRGGRAVALSDTEKKVGREWRDQQFAALSLLNQVSPPDLTVLSTHRYVRHDCPARGGVSFALELREHYERSPEFVAYLDGDRLAGLVLVNDGAGASWPVPEGHTAEVLPPGVFGFIWKWGKCSACGVIARSGDGRFVIASERPPDSRSARDRTADIPG